MRICFMWWSRLSLAFFFFFFNDTATTEIYTLSLHDALPICRDQRSMTREHADLARGSGDDDHLRVALVRGAVGRSEEHTSELQSQSNLVCRLLLEKKKTDARVGSRPARRQSARTCPSTEPTS